MKDKNNKNKLKDKNIKEIENILDQKLATLEQRVTSFEETLNTPHNEFREFEETFEETLNTFKQTIKNELHNEFCKIENELKQFSYEFRNELHKINDRLDDNDIRLEKLLHNRPRNSYRTNDEDEFDLYYGGVDSNGEFEVLPPELYKIR